jgi:hypothetical protein
MTFFAKFIFIPVWIGGFGAGTIALWIGRHNCGPCSTPTDVRWQFLIIWLIASLILLAGPGRHKKVGVDDTMLHVSNYWRRVAVPFSEIASVTTRWLPDRAVVVHLRSPTIFGKSISFIPRLWQLHSVVRQLRQLAGLSSDGRSRL